MARPNIVFIFSDQHRADWMSCAGPTAPVQTPNLDALAERGVRFLNAHTNYPLCGPARMSMLTGRHPHRNGIYINEHTLRSDTPTFVHGLGLAGYETVLAGRMHFMGADQRHGFERRLVGDICRCYGGGPRTDFGPLSGAESNVKKHLDLTGPGQNAVRDYDRAVTDAFVEFLRERGDSGEDRPLFATVGWYGPHPPFACDAEYYEAARQALQRGGPEAVAPDAVPHPSLGDRVTGDGEEGAEALLRARANYAGMIRHMDDMIGRVLDAAENLPGETLVIYTSDHGEMAGDHGTFGKGCFYDASVKVPMIWAPLGEHGAVGGLELSPGAEVEPPVSLIDIAPTLLNMTAAPELPITDGDDLAPLLAGHQDEDWAMRPVLAEMELLLLGRPPSRMVRRDRFKYVYYHGEEPQLFDLRADPDEHHNLADDPEYSEICEQMRGLALEDWAPEEVAQDYERRMQDIRYVTRWGREVGLGALDLWDQASYGSPNG